MKRVIKRYSNRKLYDVATSSFINLTDIAARIKAGDEITVIDNDTGEDITASILISVLSDEFKKKRELKLLPILLQQLIKTESKVIADFIKNAVSLNIKSPPTRTPILVATKRLKEKGSPDLKNLLAPLIKEQKAFLDKMIKKEVNKQLKARGSSNRTNLVQLIKSLVEPLARTIDTATAKELKELKATVENLRTQLQKIGKRKTIKQ
ncbi:MAG: polyhydroxyalkanoate synthesis regulator DNA-binding domain-containing protein [candidate division WOR-3 bacterium]